MIRLTWQSRWWRGVLAIALLAPLIAAALVFRRASRATETAAAEIHHDAEAPFRIIPVDRAAPAGVDPIAASPDFRDIAEYRDTIAVSARAGLFVYDRN